MFVLMDDMKKTMYNITENEYTVSPIAADPAIFSLLSLCILGGGMYL